MSPRHVDQVSRFFAELGSTDESKCIRVQCLFCQQIKAKNTTRQKEHLRSCKPYLDAHPEAALEQQADGNPAGLPPGVATGLPMSNDQYPPPIPLGGPGGTTNVSFAPNPRINGTPMQTPIQPPVHPNPSGNSSDGPVRKKQKAVKQPKKQPTADADEIPLAAIHAAFEEFQGNPDDKCITARCRYCNNARAKNTSRQRDHLRTCAEYIKANKDKMVVNNNTNPVNTNQQNGNLGAQVPTQPAPTLDYDFRLAVKLNNPMALGAMAGGHESWVTCVGGQWNGRYGNGSIIPGGHDLLLHIPQPSANHHTRLTGQYLIQTDEQPPARIICKIQGWKVGNQGQKVSIEMETGDDRHSSLNTGLWVATGSQRGFEIIYDAYRVG